MKRKKRQYTRHEGSNRPGRPAGKVAALAKKAGISRQLAWYRLNQSAKSRRRKAAKSAGGKRARRDPLAVLGGMD